MWRLVYMHPLTGRLTDTVGTPTSILCLGPLNYELSWRDPENRVAYYDRFWPDKA